MNQVTVNKEFLIVNSSGGVIFSSIDERGINEILVLGSTIHSLFEIAKEFFKTEASKFVIEYSNHNIWIYKTLSKTFFIFFWLKNEEPPFNRVYLHYSEKVICNYFYSIDMPIKDPCFDPKRFF